MKILIIGAGKSGLGVARLLSKGNDEITLYNENKFSEIEELEKLGIDVIIDSFSNIDLSKYDEIVKAPGIAGFDEALNEIEIAYRNSSNYKYYAVSGTNGKTTTTDLLYKMLRKESSDALACGNIGYALSQAVYDHGNTKRNVALEISAFQMDGLKTVEFDAYALMNLSPDHLDRYETEEEYYQAKLKMLKHSEVNIINIDDKNIMKRLDEDIEYLSLSIKGKADIYVDQNWAYFKDVKLFKISDLKLAGKHNLMNAMFAASLAHIAGIELKLIQEAIAEYKGVEHRLEFIREINGVRYYNDSKATNPESTQVCLEAFDGNIHLIAGGYDKKISFDLLKQYENKLKSISVYGESADLLLDVFPLANKFSNMLEATEAANKLVEKGDVLVLSPACASYDQFKNFEERGIIFKNYIKTL